jgi:ATP-dependent helicase/DNAse subunit B
VFHKILKKIWEKEEIPRDWKEGIIVKVPKKGDLIECTNWRGITLLNTSRKLLTRIMLERLKKETDKKLRENQAALEPKDHVPTILQL